MWAGGARVAPGDHAAADGARRVVTAFAAAASPGAAAYAQFCAACHGAAGQGTPGSFPPLAKDPVVDGDPQYLARVVLYGLQGRVTVNGQAYGSPMAGLAGSMSDAQIGDVLTYIRSSWGNGASAFGADVVKAERAVPGTPQDNAAKHPK